jgi:4-hydroxy-tetrahydrodipicolinate synthase
MKLEGVYTALVTPFGKDGSVDETRLREFVEFQITEGISGLLPMGTTGECPTLSHEEHLRVIEIVIQQSAGRVPVIAGTGSNCTREAVELTQRARKLGADMTLQVAPYYNKPSQEGFYRHFMEVADKGGLPTIVYNIPGRSGKNIENSTMLRLAGHPLIVGVKEASGSIPQVMDLIEKKPENFAVLSGDDNLGLPIIALGGTGIISVASNIIPRRMMDLVKTLLTGNIAAGREEHYRLLAFFRALFIETNPIPVKYGCALKGMMDEVYRLPMCPMDDDKKAVLKNAMQQAGIL